MSKKNVKLCSFKSVQSNVFRDALQKAGLKKASICISAVEGMEILKQTGGVVARRNSSGTNSTPVSAMGTLIKEGLAAFHRASTRYELTPEGVSYYEQLQTQGLVTLALELRDKINAFEEVTA
jgi:hypothetical protein